MCTAGIWSVAATLARRHLVVKPETVTRWWRPLVVIYVSSAGRQCAIIIAHFIILQSLLGGTSLTATTHAQSETP